MVCIQAKETKRHSHSMDKEVESIGWAGILWIGESNLGSTFKKFWPNYK